MSAVFPEAFCLIKGDGLQFEVCVAWPLPGTSSSPLWMYYVNAGGLVHNGIVNPFWVLLQWFKCTHHHPTNSDVINHMLKHIRHKHWQNGISFISPLMLMTSSCAFVVLPLAEKHFGRSHCLLEWLGACAAGLVPLSASVRAWNVFSAWLWIYSTLWDKLQ